MPAWFTRAQSGAAAGSAFGALFGGVGTLPGALIGAGLWAGIGAVSDWEGARTLARENANVPGAERESVIPAASA